MNKILITFFSILFITGCTSSDLSGKKFVMLNSYNDAKIILNFSNDGQSYSGKVVNNYFGSYSTSGDSISFVNTGVTMMMGPHKLMDAENKYFEDLSQIKKFKFDGAILTLDLDNGKSLKFQEDGFSDF